jgi:hypothetical protein
MHGNLVSLQMLAALQNTGGLDTPGANGEEDGVEVLRGELGKEVGIVEGGAVVVG